MSGEGTKWAIEILSDTLERVEKLEQLLYNHINEARMILVEPYEIVVAEDDLNFLFFVLDNEGVWDELPNEVYNKLQNMRKRYYQE